MSFVTQWEIVLLVIYCHGWEFEATIGRVKKISGEFCIATPDILIRDLEAMGLITVQDNKLVLTKKGLNVARSICERYNSICDEISRTVWREVSKQFTTLKRFMQK
jgi:ribosomal protein S19E (S16A)